MPLPSFSDLYKKHEEEEESSWLISFSDMMCLLLCFFIVLVAISGLDLVKIELFGERFAKAEKITMRRLQQMIQEFIDSEGLQEEVSVGLTSKGVEISFKDKLLFDLGKADLKPRAIPILTKISDLLNYKEISQRKIYVEGHTDSLPIKSVIYPSNWELSSARAANVVKFFIAQNLDSKRFEAIGYADTHPIKLQTDKILGQPENRRVVVVISPESYLAKVTRKEIPVEPYSAKVRQKEIQVKEIKYDELVKESKQPKQMTIDPEKKVSKKRQMEQYFSLGQKYFLQKKYKEAIESWKKVLELDPQHQLSKINIQRAKKRLSGK